MMQIIKAGEGQTFLDIAMQYCGDALRADEIAVLNGQPVTAGLQPGQDITIPIVVIDKINVVAAFEERELIPASSEEDFKGEVLDGIDYWAIEEDFIVQ